MSDRVSGEPAVSEHANTTSWPASTTLRATGNNGTPWPAPVMVVTTWLPGRMTMTTVDLRQDT